MDLEVGGRCFHVSTVGERGPAVVLVHSSGMSGRQFRGLAEELGADHRVFLPDLVGYGKNPVWHGALFDVEEDTALVQATVDAAGGEVALLGHSYGAWIALRVAQRVRTRALVLIEPVAFGVLYDPPDPALVDLAALDAHGDFFEPALAGSPQWCERFVNWWGGAGAWARMGPIMQGMLLQRAEKTFHEVHAVALDRAGLQDYRPGPPTLLIRGETTRLAAARVVELLAARLGAREEIIRGAGHMAPLTHADAVAALVVTFLRAS